ncbi:hypothetical protein GCM10009579_65770 [Streptomyces javensis]|uniref:Uncharacterized protein n=1 Tax=Streptomyces javensis TaxID=114698 RepID=A0ABP4HVV7_9ACTN
MVLVRGVAVAVVDVVHMVAVRYGDMSAVVTVLVVVAFVDGVATGLALIDVVVVRPVQMAVVYVVGVIPVRERDVAAAASMLVGVVGVGSVRGHGDTFFLPPGPFCTPATAHATLGDQDLDPCRPGLADGHGDMAVPELPDRADLREPRCRSCNGH